MAPHRFTPAVEVASDDTEFKRPRKGFTVGPQNLPDGTHRRKVQKIKHDLIRKVKLKKSYNKLKEREGTEIAKPVYNPLDEPADEPASLELHPDRQAMVDNPEATATTTSLHNVPETKPKPRKEARPKPVPFKKEAQLAQQRREEQERQQKEYEESQRQRQVKIEERERFRKAMAQARSGGRDGQRKLGRESKVLLEKVQRMVNG